MLIQAILIFVVALIAYLQDFSGTTFIGRPLFTGLLLGIVFGDVPSGVLIGAQLEMIWMGSMQIGATIPPDVISGGILGCAFALKMGSGADVALTLALPIALLYLLVENSFYVVINPLLNHRADYYVEKGKFRQGANMHIVSSLLRPAVSAVIIAVAYYLGADAVQGLINLIPSTIMDGMSVATGLLPAIGFAMLLNMTFSSKVLPFFCIGFVLSAYLGLNIVAIAIIGAAIGIVMYMIMDKIQKTPAQIGGGNLDEEF